MLRDATRVHMLRVKRARAVARRRCCHTPLRMLPRCCRAMIFYAMPLYYAFIDVMLLRHAAMPLRAITLPYEEHGDIEYA